MKRILSVLMVLAMVLCLSACGSNKYEDIVEMLDNKDYAGAIHAISQMAMAEQMAGQEGSPVLEILANTWTTNADKGPQELTFTTDGNLTVDGKAMTWTAEGEGFGPEMNLQIFEDGVPRYHAWICASDRYAVPFVELNYMEEIDGMMVSGDYIGRYYNHPMVTVLMSSWNAVSEYEKVVDGFWISSGDATINGDSYSWEVTDASSQEQLTIHASGKNGAEGEYTMTVSMRGEYPVMTFTDDSTGTTGLYYRSDFGRDETWVEYRYAEVMNLLNRFVKDGYVWTDEASYEEAEAVDYLHGLLSACEGYRDSADILNNWDSVTFSWVNRYLQEYLEDGYFYAGPENTSYNDYSGAVEYFHGLLTEISGYSEAAALLENWNDVLLVRANRILGRYLEGNSLYLDDMRLTDNQHLAYVYEQFKAIEGSDEATAILANFTIVPQAYTGANYIYVDNLGNEGGSTWETFKYDANGRMIFADYADEMFETYGESSDLHFYYDAAGVLTEVKIAYNPESSVTAVLTPSYDANGNLVSISAAYNNGTRTYTYTYDEADNRTSAVINQNVNGGTDTWYIYSYTYTYDAVGRLAQKVYTRNNTVQTTTYTYDANGYLIQETMVEQYKNYNNELEYRYTETLTYTNDTMGRRVAAVLTSDENGFNYKSYTITYNYENLYFYNEG